MKRPSFKPITKAINSVYHNAHHVILSYNPSVSLNITSFYTPDIALKVRDSTIRSHENSLVILPISYFPVKNSCDSELLTLVFRNLSFEPLTLLFWTFPRVFYDQRLKDYSYSTNSQSSYLPSTMAILP